MADSATQIGEVTDWLHRLRRGEVGAMDRLVPLLYEELRALARRRRRGIRLGETLVTTALVHETYLKLHRHRQVRAEDRGQFLALAGVTMRRILLDHARAQLREKRGGGKRIAEAPGAQEQIADPRWMSHAEAEEVLALDHALNLLETINPLGAAVVNARFFAGLTLAETAQQLGISVRTAQRKWLAARAWLRKEIGGP